jgi:uncharacterized protein (UPF0218 family)
MGRIIFVGGEEDILVVGARTASSAPSRFAAVYEC